MLSRQSAEHWRKLTFSERLKVVLTMIDEAVPYLLRGTPEQIERRFDLLRRQNDERNRNMLAGIARSEERQ